MHGSSSAVSAEAANGGLLPGVGFSFPGFEIKDSVSASGSVFRVSGFDLGFGFTLVDFGFRVLGFGFRVQLSGVWVSGSGIGISGVGFGAHAARVFRVSGLGLSSPGLSFIV